MGRSGGQSKKILNNLYSSRANVSRVVSSAKTKSRPSNKKSKKEKALSVSEMKKMSNENLRDEFYERLEPLTKKIQKKHKEKTGKSLDSWEAKPYKGSPISDLDYDDKLKKMSVKDKRAKYLNNKEREQLDYFLKVFNKRIKKHNDEVDAERARWASRPRGGLTRHDEEMNDYHWANRTGPYKERKSRFFWDY